MYQSFGLQKISAGTRSIGERASACLTGILACSVLTVAVESWNQRRLAVKIGDKVQWTSQSAGYSKTKSGVIVAIVPIGYPPQASLLDNYELKSVPGMCRDHESYLVAVGKSKRLYWPRVSNLAAIEKQKGK
jgi:hypothetical protein